MLDDSLSAARVRLVGLLALALGLFHLANVSGLLVLSTMIVRAVHLTVMVTLVFLRPWEPAAERLGGVRGYWSTLLWIISLVTGAYLLVRWDEIALSGGITTSLDIAVASIIILLVLEATRRSVGNFLAIITVAFLLYPFVSPVLADRYVSHILTHIPEVNPLMSRVNPLYPLTPISYGGVYI